MHKLYTDKLESMVNMGVVSFYETLGQIYEGSEDMANGGIEKSFAITPLSVDASSRENPSECPHNSYIPKIESPWRRFSC